MSEWQENAALTTMLASMVGVLLALGLNEVISICFLLIDRRRRKRAHHQARRYWG